MTIYCVQCAQDVEARLTNGAEIYPHRPDLASLPFWRCDTCHNYVGCHNKTDNPTRPLGVIPTPELLAARKKIHQLLDPIWKRRLISRAQAYTYIGKRLGWPYHTGDLRSIEEAREVWRIVGELRNELMEHTHV